MLYVSFFLNHEFILNCIRTLGNLFKILFIRIMNLENTYYTVKAETL